MNIGIDCVKIDRFYTLFDQEKFIKKIFTKKEIDYCLNKKNKYECFAGKYAAKEAVKKCIGKNENLDFSNIEILNDEKGFPFVILNIFDKNYNLKISITHEDGIAIAIALCKE